MDSRRTPVWDGQIQLEEDDSSDDGILLYLYCFLRCWRRIICY